MFDQGFERNLMDMIIETRTVIALGDAADYTFRQMGVAQ
jgi:hypothetical protein